MNPWPMTRAAALALTAGGAAAMEDAALREEARRWFEPIPTTPPTLEDNVASPARVALGKQLFFDPRLSRSGVLSCNACHKLGMGGVDGLQTSIGHGWQAGPRNAPTVYNAVFNVAQFWDGRAKDLAEQAKGPVQASVEMNSTPERVLRTLGSMPAYVEAFAAAFPDAVAPMTFDTMARAIEAFEATLITPHAPFDRFLRGDDDALSARQKRGLASFIDTGCATCHGGVNLGGQDYYPFGVMQKPGAEVLPRGDRGRFRVTETATDDYVFRAAPLRNIALTAPYFHSGAVWALREAVAIMGVAQLGAALDEGQIDDITAFLHGLTGRMPEIAHPMLPPRGAGTPLPQPQ